MKIKIKPDSHKPESFNLLQHIVSKDGIEKSVRAELLDKLLLKIPEEKRTDYIDSLLPGENVTALNKAASLGDFASVQILQKYGANADAKTRME